MPNEVTLTFSEEAFQTLNRLKGYLGVTTTSGVIERVFGTQLLLCERIEEGCEVIVRRPSGEESLVRFGTTPTLGS